MLCRLPLPLQFPPDPRLLRSPNNRPPGSLGPRRRLSKPHRLPPLLRPLHRTRHGSSSPPPGCAMGRGAEGSTGQDQGEELDRARVPEEGVLGIDLLGSLCGTVSRGVDHGEGAADCDDPFAVECERRVRSLPPSLSFPFLPLLPPSLLFECFLAHSSQLTRTVCRDLAKGELVDRPRDEFTIASWLLRCTLTSSRVFPLPPPSAPSLTYPSPRRR